MEAGIIFLVCWCCVGAGGRLVVHALWSAVAEPCQVVVGGHGGELCQVEKLCWVCGVLGWRGGRLLFEDLCFIAVPVF